jgi:hypothetical protein
MKNFHTAFFRTSSTCVIHMKMPLDFHLVCLWPFGIIFVFMTGYLNCENKSQFLDPQKNP